MATAEARDYGCPFCTSHDVSRLYLASVHMDSCECTTCGARWDEDCSTGAFRGRGDRASVLMPRRRG